MSKLIILDWDDTLFPTSWSMMNDINFTKNNMFDKYKPYFTDLDNVLYNFLVDCMKYGKVFIVTNAMKRWISKTSELLPKSSELLKNIIIISAKDLHQKKFPKQINQWKLLVFKYIADTYTVNHDYDHVISIGDADYEFNALLDLINHHNIKNQGYLKSIRLVSAPSYDTLIDQLHTLNKSINKICLANKHMDLQFKGI
jgi:hypothetical protein